LTETIEYEQFEQSKDSSGSPEAATDVDLSRLSDIPMELSVEIGRTHMTVGDTLDLRVGSVVTLERLAGEAADLLVNGSAIARGEVVVIDEQYGLRITEILDGHPDMELTEPSAGGSRTPVEPDRAPEASSGAETPAAEAPAADADADDPPAQEG
jgi:flagellar motor switch protein FliN